MSSVSGSGSAGGSGNINKNMGAQGAQEAGQANAPKTNSPTGAAPDQVTRGSGTQAGDKGVGKSEEKPALNRPNAPANNQNIENGRNAVQMGDALSVNGEVVQALKKNDLRSLTSEATIQELGQAMHRDGRVGANGVVTGAGDAAHTALMANADDNLQLGDGFVKKAEAEVANLRNNPDAALSDEAFSIFSLLILMGKLQTAQWDASDKAMKNAQASYLLTFDEKAESIRDKANIEFVTGISTAVITGAFAAGTGLRTMAKMRGGNLSPTEINTLHQSAAMWRQGGEMLSGVTQSVGKRMASEKDALMQMIEKSGAAQSHTKDLMRNLRDDVNSKANESYSTAGRFMSEVLQAQRSIQQNI